MVAVINSGRSIRNTFYYNENKVKEGVAEYLMAVNYPLDTEDLNERMRLNMLLKTAELNTNIKRPAIHISLNFPPEEQHSKEKMKALAFEYMERIGFGEQPFLVYQHKDAGHDHIHILTTKIRYNGSCINTNNIGRNQSETARKEMEIKYGLIKAEDQKASAKRMEPIDASKVQYGKLLTKRAISNVLNTVLNSFKYSSLAEFNAVLKLYNVTAERGSEGSRTYKSGGLVFRVLNKEGIPISAPIKASAFAQKPTLKYLESLFLRNDVQRQSYKPRIKSTIDLILKSKGVKDMDQFSKALSAKQIAVVERRSKDGLLYGLTYVDLKSKVVFNGSSIGKSYGAKAIQEIFLSNNEVGNTPGGNSLVPLSVTKQSSISISPNSEEVKVSQEETRDSSTSTSLIEQLMQPENGTDYLPYHLRTTKKKRKNKKL